MYIHELPNWPQFQWDGERLAKQLASVHFRQGKLLGQMSALGFKDRQDVAMKTLTTDVLKTSEIEGERLDPEQVRSSVARRLGIEYGGLVAASHDVEGIVEVLVDATERYDEPLTAERLYGWHSALFPTGRSGLRRIQVGAWRTSPIDVVSPRGQVYFEGPEAERLDKEMEAFLRWFEEPATTDPVLRAGLAHLWFVTIHPFEDGNGRIARAIADMALARAEANSQRFYSMSAQIQTEHSEYYQILEQTQKGEMEITRWMEWFLACLGHAIDRSESELTTVREKGQFWDSVRELSINERQRLVLNRLFDGFEGTLTSSKYAKLTKTSGDTALRDIQYLVDKKILMRNEEGGRSTSYSLVPGGSGGA